MQYVSDCPKSATVFCRLCNGAVPASEYNRSAEEPFRHPANCQQHVISGQAQNGVFTIGSYPPHGSHNLLYGRQFQRMIDHPLVRTFTVSFHRCRFAGQRALLHGDRGLPRKPGCSKVASTRPSARIKLRRNGSSENHCGISGLLQCAHDQQWRKISETRYASGRVLCASRICFEERRCHEKVRQTGLPAPPAANGRPNKILSRFSYGRFCSLCKCIILLSVGSAGSVRSTGESSAQIKGSRAGSSVRQ